MLYADDIVYTVDMVYTVDTVDIVEKLCMNTLFYIDCLCHEEFKNILQNGLWELYAVTVNWSVGRMDGWDGTDHTLLDCYKFTTARAPAVLIINTSNRHIH